MGLRGLYKVAATTAASWDLLLKALIQVTVDCDRFCPNTVKKSLLSELCQSLSIEKALLL